jgi:hypothetical protein
VESERFSASDLEPSPADRRRARLDVADNIAASVAVLAVGVVVGGMIALGACAAPFVFQTVPAPLSGYAMGSAFARFDRIAIGLSCLLLGAEVVRTFLARRSPTRLARVRRVLSIAFAACTVYIGVTVSPGINALYREGARMGEGAEGERLAAFHARASLIGKAEGALGLAIILLHFLGRRTAPDDDDDGVAFAPFPPGPKD